MAQLRVSLSIGHSTAKREAIIEVDDVELAECETDEDREELLNEYWQGWADNYIDGSYELVE